MKFCIVTAVLSGALLLGASLSIPSAEAQARKNCVPFRRVGRVTRLILNGDIPRHNVSSFALEFDYDHLFIVEPPNSQFWPLLRGNKPRVAVAGVLCPSQDGDVYYVTSVKRLPPPPVTTTRRPSPAESAESPIEPVDAPPPPLVVVPRQNIQVAAGQFVYYRFVLRRPGTLRGRFRAYGGGNDIHAAVISADEFLNLSNGQSTPAYYSSGGYKTTGKISCLLGPGAYYIVLDNRKAMLFSKVVDAAFAVTFN